MNRSNIAIDDLEIELGDCPAVASCNFETGMCGYSNSRGQGDDFDWQLGQGQVAPNTGPSVDHTTNSARGFYAFANSQQNRSSEQQPAIQRAWLTSELFGPRQQPGCLTWYMYLHGAEVKTLTIYKRPINTNNKTNTSLTTIWTIAVNK
jgi:hypothetical protein